MFAVLDDLQSVRLVCRQWRDQLDEWALSEIVLPIQTLCHTSRPMAESGSSERQKMRFQFLEESLRLINRWQLPLLPHLKLWRSLCFELHKTLVETEQIVALVEKGCFQVNENFDVYELSLRRYYQAIEFLQASKLGGSPLLLLSDIDARNVWRKNFGESKLSVSWVRFEQALFPQKTNRFLSCVKFLVNFPADDLITLYKFDLLCRHFGPYPDLGRNIDLYAMGKGFVGLVNRIHAKKLLTDQWRLHRDRGWYLIRLSRTEPQYVVFSYIKQSGTVVHTLNKDKSIQEAILKKFGSAHFACMPVRMSEEAYENEALMAYAACSHGYVTIDSYDADSSEDGAAADNGVEDDGSYLKESLIVVEPTPPRVIPSLNRADSYSIFEV